MLDLGELLEDRSDADALAAARARLAAANFLVAVVGEFSSGKSFLLNALLGKVGVEASAAGKRVTGLLATDINPSTATITEIEYGAQESATAYFADGREERIPLDRLSRFVAVGATEEGRLHDATHADRAAPVSVRVTVDSPFLREGFVVADTPGLASINPAHRRATLAFLPRADAVLYLIDTQQPFTEGDASFLGIIRRNLDSVFIVQTKIDLWRISEGEDLEAWQHAYARIAALAARFSPGTPVLPVSAREYAEGLVEGDSERKERSRFPALLEALNASLVTTTGGSRVRRALEIARSVAGRAEAQVVRDAAALERGEERLRRDLEEAHPIIERLRARSAAERSAIVARSRERAANILESGLRFAESLEDSLARTLDVSDIAVVRDRAKLHVLIDQTVARFAETFAREIASGALTDLRSFGLDVPLGAWAARSFGQDGSSGMWSADADAALRSSIILRAIGGPAIDFVSQIADRFAASPRESYMKRELTRDLQGSFFPTLRANVAVFTDEISTAIQRVYDDLAGYVGEACEREVDALAGTIVRALAVIATTRDPGQTIATLQARGEAVRSALREAEAEAAAFLSTLAPPSTARVPLADDAQEPAEATFDPQAYDRGLRPERWRVCVLGGLRRGKSSLINAIAGSRVLNDEGGGEIAFPVHVRYGETERAHALDERGEWREIDFEYAVDEAKRAPLLIEVPWTLPRQLVLVHAPAFDVGDARAEEIALVAARAASETLCLFSRQLSDRELALYARVAQLGKPMLFAHTLADNELPADRRKVVDLAGRYLQERGVRAERIFIVSTLEYRQAKREGRAPAGWNELDALAATIAAHADAHMERLARAERDRANALRLAQANPVENGERAPSLVGMLRSLLRKGRR